MLTILLKSAFKDSCMWKKRLISLHVTFSAGIRSNIRLIFYQFHMIPHWAYLFIDLLFMFVKGEWLLQITVSNSAHHFINDIDLQYCWIIIANCISRKKLFGVWVKVVVLRNLSHHGGAEIPTWGANLRSGCNICNFILFIYFLIF